MNVRLLLIVAFAFLNACGGDGKSDSGGGSSSSDKEDVIVVLGDSIGAGVAATINFPDIIAGLTGIQVINTSTPGISAEGGVSTAQSRILQYNPKYIVSLLGTNNALGAGNKVEGAVNSQRFLASLCIENEIICVIGTLPHITLSGKVNARAESISAGIRGIRGVRIADVRVVMNGSHTSPDGIHPNNAGQQIIGEVFAAQID